VKSRYAEIWALTQRQMSGFPIEEATRRFGEVPVDEQQQVLEAAWQRGGFEFLFATFTDVLVDDAANQAIVEFIRTKIHETVDDPATAELLCPKGYPFGAKRPPLGHFYYEAFNRDNVTLIDVSTDAIERIVPTGVRTGREEFDVDVLIFATGFDSATGALQAFDIRGRGGRSLKDDWSAGPRTFMGLTVDGFPNLFIISGPQTPFGNIPVVIENSVRWIGRAIDHARKTQIAFEPTTESVDGWVREVARIFGRSFVRYGEDAHSWMLGANVKGKPHVPLFYFGRANVYFERLGQVADAGFEEFVRG
jgi:cation diffusion facilitator CzcD-associated flavoprotein CzcO